MKELEKLKVVEIDQFGEEKTIMCTMKKYRPRYPNTVEAVQFTGENWERKHPEYRNRDYSMCHAVRYSIDQLKEEMENLRKREDENE